MCSDTQSRRGEEATNFTAFAVKELFRRMAAPTTHDAEALGALVALFVGAPAGGVGSQVQSRTLNGFTGRDWAGCLRTHLPRSGWYSCEANTCSKREGKEEVL